MKRSLFIFFVLALVFASCHRHDVVYYPFSKEEAPCHYTIYAEVTPLMTLQSDSAMRMLMDFHKSVSIKSLSRPDYFEFLLLSAEAGTKAPIDSFLVVQSERTFCYYDSLHEKYPNSDAISVLLAKSYFCVASTKDKSDNFLAACDNYFKALDLAEKVDDSRYPFINDFIALTYNRLGMIFYNNESWNIAIDNLKMANVFFDRNNTAIGSAFNYETIGEIFYQAGNQDSAMCYFRIADSAISNLADAEFDFNIQQTLVNNKARTSFSVGDKEKAYALLNESISMASDESECKSHYGLLAELYYLDGFNDSALYYYEKSFPFGPFERTRMLNNMVTLCYKTGAYEKAAYYATFLGEEVERSKTKLALVQHYENHVKDVELQSQHQVSVRHNVKNVVVMFLIFGVIVVFLLFFYKRLKKLLVSNKAQHQQSMKEKEKELKHKELELEMTKKKLSFEEKPGDFAGRRVAFEASPIVMKIKNLVEKEDVMTKNLKGSSTPLLKDKDIIELVKVVNQNFDDFTSILAKNFARLTSNDIRYCCLFFLNLKQKEVAALMGISQSAINQKHHRLQEVFATGDSVSFFLNNYFKGIYG